MSLKGLKVTLLLVSVFCFSAGFVGTSTLAQSDDCPVCNCSYECGEDVFTFGVIGGGTCQLIRCSKTITSACQTFSCP